MEVDTIGCCVNALVKGDVPLPIANVADTFALYDPNEIADFYWIDAGAPLDDPLASLLSVGRNWYSRQRAMVSLCFGESKSGLTQHQHVQSTCTCSQHEPADALANPYEEIARIVTKAMQSVEKESPVYGVDDRPYREDEVKKQVKLMLLSMQGSWTTQHHYTWKVQNSMYDEDCRGRVYMWRPKADNTRRLMCRSDTLTNGTMFLIGRMALDAEH